MNVVRDARVALETFKQTGIMPDLPLEMEQNDYAVWQCVFEDHPGPWAELALDMNLRMAQRSLASYKEMMSMETATEEGNEAFLNVTAMLAHTLVGHYSMHNLEAGNFKSEAARREWRKRFTQLQPQIVEIWMGVFADVPTFRQHMLEQNERHAMFFPDSATVIEKYLEA